MGYLRLVILLAAVFALFYFLAVDETPLPAYSLPAPPAYDVTKEAEDSPSTHLETVEIVSERPGRFVVFGLFPESLNAESAEPLNVSLQTNFDVVFEEETGLLVATTKCGCRHQWLRAWMPLARENLSALFVVVDEATLEKLHPARVLALKEELLAQQGKTFSPAEARIHEDLLLQTLSR